MSLGAPFFADIRHKLLKPWSSFLLTLTFDHIGAPMCVAQALLKKEAVDASDSARFGLFVLSGHFHLQYFLSPLLPVGREAASEEIFARQQRREAGSVSWCKMGHHPFEQMLAKDTRYSAPSLAIFAKDMLPCRVEMSRRRRLQ